MTTPTMLSTLAVMILAALAASVAAQASPMSENDFFASLATSAAAKTARKMTAAMPKNLRDLYVGSNTLVPKYTPVTVQHASAMATAAVGGPPTGTSAHRPSWTNGADSSPRRAPALEPKPKLSFQGKDVEPDVIFSPDDRRVYVDTRYPYGCVAKVISTEGTCSGVLIGPRHVLTASHCVNWSKPYPTTVEINRRGTALSASASVSNIIYYVKQPGPLISFSTIDYDIAVLVLSKRLGDAFGWLGVQAYSSAWDNQAYWSNIGYPGDVRSAMYPIHQAPFAMKVSASDTDGDLGKVLESNMDQFKGQSGSPTYGYFNGQPTVVAVCSAEDVADRKNFEAGGANLVNLVTLARRDHP